MDQNKIKELEAKLHQLFAQDSQTKDKTSPAKSTVSGARVIRRRKGKPDLHIA
ncbi:MAG: hypothetical protein RBT11_16230 [Desulfobacterales bacterium]|jgi:hypothetical protein|nr:hypothetical protein [Desulfobacterales bacterium]